MKYELYYILLVLIIVYNLYRQSRLSREGFTKIIRQNVRPHIRQVRLYKDSFIENMNIRLNRIARKLQL